MQVAELIELVGPSVMPLRRGSRTACGLVVAPDRVVALSRSVTSGEISMRVDGEDRPAEVLADDPSAGLSILRGETGELSGIDWTATVPEVGERVFALGDPGTGLRVTEGRISAGALEVRSRTGRPLRLIEHTAPLPRGTGGGPLVRDDGTVVGLNALRGDPGFILALATQVVRPVVDRLLSSGVTSPRLGVAVAPPQVARRLRLAVGLADRDGVLVRQVEDGSAAERGGIREGDLIVAVDGNPLGSIDELYGAVIAANDKMVLEVVRGADELEVRIDLKDPRT